MQIQRPDNLQETHDLLADLLWWLKGFLAALEISDTPISEVGINNQHFHALREAKLLLLDEIQKEDARKKKLDEEYRIDAEFEIKELREKLEGLEKERSLEMLGLKND